MPTEIKRKKILTPIGYKIISGLPLVEFWESFTPSVWLNCDFQNLIPLLLYLYNVTSNIRDFEVFHSLDS
jgi:hypothetical protein